MGKTRARASFAGMLACALTLCGIIPSATAATVHHDVLDVHHLPLGDGKVGTAPKRGYVMSCRTGPGGPGGAQRDGPWIHGTTWDATEKLHVDGKVT